MAATFIGPVDPETRIPLLLAPVENDVPLSQIDEGNWHHAFHPFDAVASRGIAGRALRACGVQLVDPAIHNMSKESYHAYYARSWLPARGDDTEVCRVVTIKCALFVPWQALDMRRDDFTTPVTLKQSQRTQLLREAKPSQITSKDLMRYRQRHAQGESSRDVFRLLDLRSRRQAALSYEQLRYGYDPVRNFFRKHLFDQMAYTDSRLMKRFFTSNDETKQYAYADTLFMQAAEIAVSSFRAQYQSLHRRGLLHPSMQLRPEQLIFYKLGTYAQRGQYLVSKRQELAEAFELVA